jgi:hypothetical protein
MVASSLLDGVERQILSANLAREGQRLACRLLTWSRAGLVAKRRQTRTITFILQAGRTVLRPGLFAMLSGERAHAAPMPC